MFAKSDRPIEPAKSASPVNRASPIRSVTPPGLWPGCAARRRRARRRRRAGRHQRVDVLERGQPAGRTLGGGDAVGHDGPLGVVDRDRDAPNASRSRERPAMWSMSVWVRRIAFTWPPAGRQLDHQLRLQVGVDHDGVERGLVRTRYELPRTARRRWPRRVPSRGFAGHGVDVSRPPASPSAARTGRASRSRLWSRPPPSCRRTPGPSDGHVDAVLGDDGGDVAQQPGAVPGLDLDRDRVELRRLRVPVDRHHAAPASGAFTALMQSSGGRVTPLPRVV